MAYFLYSEFDEYEERRSAPLHLIYLRQSSRYGWPWPPGWMDWPAYHYTRIRLAAAIEAALSGYADADDKGHWLMTSSYAKLYMDVQRMISKAEKHGSS